MACHTLAKIRVVAAPLLRHSSEGRNPVVMQYIPRVQRE